MKWNRTQNVELRSSATLLMVLLNLVIYAQCPVGSIINTAGTYHANETVCISTNFSGAITLKNKATLYVAGGGNYTGNVTANKGSLITVVQGAIFKPNGANNFAAQLSNQGTVELGNGGLTLKDGADISNDATFNWVANWNMNGTVTVTNSACGSMLFKNTGYAIQNSSTLNNNGYMVFESNLSSSSGTLINNRGRLYVNGTLNPNGQILNQSLFAALGSVTLNGGDSLVNLDRFFFKNGITGSKNIRNDGLVRIAGSFQYNAGTIKQNNSGAQLRIDGALVNNPTIQGAGNLYIAGAAQNNGTIKGLSGAAKLNVNQNLNGTTSNLNLNAAMIAYDTSNYVTGWANPDVCALRSMPVSLFGFKAMKNDNFTELSWSTASETNSSRFEVEWSADGSHFTNIGEVAAGGNSNQRLDYHFEDRRSRSGTNFYRLKMVDLDQSFEYSKTALINGQTAIASANHIAPNPFSSQFEVQLYLNRWDRITIRLLDHAGKCVRQMDQAAGAGTNRIILNGLGNLAPGIYLAEISTSTDRIIQKCVKQ